MNTITAKGELQIDVLGKDGKVKHSTPWISNLLLNNALSQQIRFGISSSSTCYIFTDDNGGPNKQSIGTYSQAGNIVTRDSGTFDFTSDAFNGDTIKFANGKRALILSRDSATQCTVYEFDTITGETAEIHHTGRTTSTSGYEERSIQAVQIEDIEDHTNATVRRDYQYNFNQATTAYDIQVIRISSYARIVLPSVIPIAVGDTPRIRYRYTRTMGNVNPIVVSDIGVAGWPHQHPITNISSNGSNISLTSVNHSFEAGDSVVISGTTNYDGSYTVSSVVDTNNIQLTSSLNVATETSGNISVPDSSATIALFGRWGGFLDEMSDELYFAPTQEITPLPGYEDQPADLSVTVGKSASTISNNVNTGFTYGANISVTPTEEHKRIRQMQFKDTGSTDNGVMVEFNHHQTKTDTNSLGFTLSMRFQQDLS